MKLISFSGQGRSHVRMKLDCGTFVVTGALFNSLACAVGESLTEDAFSLVEGEDAEFRAMKKALSILSYGDNSKKELYSKLVSKGFTRELAVRCVEECVALGYVNEKRQIERLALREAVSLRGREYIIAKLCRRGYRASDVIGVIDALVDEGEIDFSENLDRLCERFGVFDDEGRRVLAHKYGYGER